MLHESFSLEFIWLIVIFPISKQFYSYLTFVIFYHRINVEINISVQFT